MPTSRAKDLADFIAKQSTHSDSILETGAMQLPSGTTGERPTAVAGMIRFNSTLSLSEYYDGSQWKSIDAPPVVSSISPTTETDANANITISGSNFQSGATVKFVGNDGTEYNSPSVTFNSVSEIVATTPATALSVANEPYDIKVENPSGLSGTLGDGLDAGGVPAFTTSAGTVTIYDSERGTSFDAGATDPDGDTITYSVSSGSLPAGASLNSSTGAITGFSAVGTDTASTFTISAATASDTSTRTWTLNIKAPIITSYTSSSGSYSVPSGITAVDVLLVAGGGGGGGRAGAGGGAGGLVYRPLFPVTPGGSVSYSIGSGGGGGGQAGGKGTTGQNTTFGTLTAQGGGGGGDAADTPPQTKGLDGGSGGGHGYGQITTADFAGSGTQPQQPGDSGTYGFGNPGGYGSGHPQAGGGVGGQYNTGGGGGAGAVGGQGDGTNAGDGGAGKQYSISGTATYYAGGGGGGSHTPHGPASSGGQGGGGNGAINSQNGSSGSANRGGGGGGAGSNGGPGGTGGTGGSGIVIVSY